jgi:hypothetical protein
MNWFSWLVFLGERGFFWIAYLTSVPVFKANISLNTIAIRPPSTDSASRHNPLKTNKALYFWGLLHRRVSGCASKPYDYIPEFVSELQFIGIKREFRHSMARVIHTVGYLGVRQNPTTTSLCIRGVTTHWDKTGLSSL